MTDNLSNSQRKWKRKIAILSSIKGTKAKRERALGQMNMSGNEWVRAQVELGMLPPKVLRSLSDTPVRLDRPLGAV